jgi:hypothetical protein
VRVPTQFQAKERRRLKIIPNAFGEFLARSRLRHKRPACPHPLPLLARSRLRHKACPHTTASSARSIIRPETNHSGILNFLCGVFGWQKWSGIAAPPCVVRRDE